MDKQIEEMAIANMIQAYLKNNDIKVSNILLPLHIEDMLIRNGYRKIPEWAVFLTSEEYQRYERIEKIIKLSKMEKANGYEVKNGKLYYFSNLLEGFEYEFKDLQEICDMANYYNEGFWDLDQQLTFWKSKAEETRKETAEKFAEMLKERSFDEYAPDGRCYECVAVSDIDEICKEFTEGKGMKNETKKGGSMGDNFDCGYHEYAKEKHKERVAKNQERIDFAIKMFEKNDIEFVLKNEQTGHFHCHRKSDNKLFQFYAGTGKIVGESKRGIHALVDLLNNKGKI